tara:strand:- start:3935 stop:4570 length:636 start_codon:yes stop_codon:yes gene_type:complete
METVLVLYAKAVSAGQGELALVLLFLSYVCTRVIKSKLGARKKDKHYDVVMEADEAAADHCDFIRTLISADRAYILEFRNGAVSIAGHSLLRMYMKYPDSRSFDTNSIYSNLQGIPLRLILDWAKILRKGNVVSIPDAKKIKKVYNDRYNLMAAHGTDSLYMFPLRSQVNGRFFGAGVIGFCNGNVTLADEQIVLLQREFNKLVQLMDKSL